MSMLMVNDWVHYSVLRDNVRLEADKKLTDGNLASHLKKLKEAGYVEEKKTFKQNKPHTTYKASISGRKAFEAHLDALEALIKGLE